MKYKGYSFTTYFDQHDNIFVGRVTGINDGINFHGQSVSELKQAFHESIDDYLEACKKLGQEPNKPYSDNLILEIPTEIHAAIAFATQTSSKSINQWTTGILKEAIY